MSGGTLFVVGIVVGFALAAMLSNNPGCCASLGAAANKKYGLPDFGVGADSIFGGAISALGLV